MRAALAQGRPRRAGRLLAALGLLAAGCAEARRPSFVLVVVDTLRADHLAPDAPAPTPRVAALARQGSWFRRAFATAPWTLPSVASLLTSQLGSEHRAVRWGNRLAPERESLAEVLRAHGYRTATFTSNALLGRETGLDQGFEVYELLFSPAAAGLPPGEPFPNAAAERVGSAALAWLRQIRAEEPGAPFFAYLHLMEPHTPYLCPDPPDPDCRARADALNRRLLAEQWGFAEDEQELIRRLYREDVARVDRFLGRLVRAFAGADLWRDTWLVLTSDHGEQLGEVGAWLHGKSLDQREIHVPLLISGPDRSARVVDDTVSLLDVAPTLLDLAGIERPAGFRGRSLVPALSGAPLSPAPAIAELFQTTRDAPRHRLAVVAGDRKLVLSPGGDVARLDLGADPGEAEPRPATRSELSRALGPREGFIDLGAPAPAADLSSETRALLRALGYAAD